MGRNKELHRCWDAGDENIFEKLEEHQKPWKVRNKIFMAELVCMAVVFAVIFGVRFWKNDPTRIAREYVQGMVRGDWNEIYDYIYLGDGDETFVDKKMFVSSQELSFNRNAVLRVEIIGTAEKMRTDDRRELQISYTKNGDNLKETVQMIRRDGIWYVDGEEKYVRENVKMKAPKGVDLYFDKEMVDQSLIVASEKNKDIYELPRVLSGAHYITFEKDGKEAYEDLIRLE